ncbi:MAG: hypothetical protein ACP5QS_03735 [bacterium]
MRKLFLLLLLLPLLWGQPPSEFPTQSFPAIPWEKIEIANCSALLTSKPFFPPQVPQIDPCYKWKFNRVLYGYVMDGNRYKLVFRLYFPSRFLSSSGNDYLPLAKKVLSYSLFFYILGRDFLGRTSQWSKDGVVDIWLCENGEGGGEQIGKNIYIYQIGKERDDVELLREVAHEWGHHIIPPVGPYEEPEEWANGYIGERLLLKLLLEHLPSALAPLKANLNSFLEKKNKIPLELFRREGDSRELLKNKGKYGFLYILGYVIDVSEKRGMEFLRDVFKKFKGGSGEKLVEFIEKDCVI